jgi:hypothetical protein
MTKANIGNSQVVIKIGRNTVLKAYRGSNVLYNPAPAAPISVSPLHLANGFLSALRADTISDSEFPNAALANGYLSVLRINDTISEAEYPNAVLANGYLGVLYIDYIPVPSATLLRGPQASGLSQWGFQHLTGSGTEADPFIVQSGKHETINFNPVWYVAGTATMHVEMPVITWNNKSGTYQTGLRLRSGSTLTAIIGTNNHFSSGAGTLLLNAGAGTHSVSVTNSFVRFTTVSDGEYVGFIPQLRIWFTGTTVDKSPLPAGNLLSGAGWTGAGRSSDRLTLSANHGDPWNISVTAAATGICVVRLLSGDNYNDGQYANLYINGRGVGGGFGTTNFSFPIVAGQQITFGGDTGGVRILQGTTLYLI